MTTKPEEKPAEKKKKRQRTVDPIVYAARALATTNADIDALKERREKHLDEVQKIEKDIAVLEKSRAEHQAALKKATGA